jgi:hypothetical protein
MVANDGAYPGVQVAKNNKVCAISSFQRFVDEV